MNCFGLVQNEACDSIILGMLWRFLRVLYLLLFVIMIIIIIIINKLLTYTVQVIPRPGQLEPITPGRRILEWFNNQSVGDFLIVELPPDSCSTFLGIVVCAVFEEDHPSLADDLSEIDYFVIECRSGEELLAVTYLPRDYVVADHLWVSYVSGKTWKRECS